MPCVPGLDGLLCFLLGVIRVLLVAFSFKFGTIVVGIILRLHFCFALMQAVLELWHV